MNENGSGIPYGRNFNEGMRNRKYFGSSEICYFDRRDAGLGGMKDENQKITLRGELRLQPDWIGIGVPSGAAWHVWPFLCWRR